MNDLRRLWLCCALVFGSPCVAMILYLSTGALLGGVNMDSPGVFIVFFFNGALAVTGEAAAGLIAPIPSVAERVALAISFALAGFVAYWFAAMVGALLLFGF